MPKRRVAEAGSLHRGLVLASDTQMSVEVFTSRKKAYTSLLSVVATTRFNYFYDLI